MEKWSLILLAIYFSLVFYPLLHPYIHKIPQDLTIDQRIVNALITASGILFGLITAITVATRGRRHPAFFAMVLGDFGLLLYAAWGLFEVALGRSSLLYALQWTMASFFGSHFTALSLLVLHWQKR